jgi:hypothetical protein
MLSALVQIRPPYPYYTLAHGPFLIRNNPLTTNNKNNKINHHHRQLIIESTPPALTHRANRPRCCYNAVQLPRPRDPETPRPAQRSARAARFWSPQDAHVVDSSLRRPWLFTGTPAFPNTVIATSGGGDISA